MYVHRSLFEIKGIVECVLIIEYQSSNPLGSILIIIGKLVISITVFAQFFCNQLEEVLPIYTENKALGFYPV